MLRVIDILDPRFAHQINTDEVFGTQVPRASIANYSRLALGSLNPAQQQ